MQQNLANIFNRNCWQQLRTQKSKHYRNYSSFTRRNLLQKKVIFFIVFSIGLVASSYSQRITIHKSNVPLQTIFAEIEKQSSYNFFYNEALLQKANNVSVDVRDASIDEALSKCFKDQGLTYALVDKTIIVKKKAEEPKVTSTVAVPNLPDRIGVSGKVTTRDGKPIAGATVIVKGTDMAVTTDENGFFRLESVEDNSVLVISSVSYLEQEIKLNRRSSVSVWLEEKIGDLDEAVVVAYNTTTQRSNVGAVTVVKGEQIQTLPNRSVDKSLQGLVPGLLVTNGNGQPGSAPANFILRGIATGGSADAGATVRNPLIVIDGIPVYQDPAESGATLSSDGSPVSNPMAQLNPSDIESISVLKDAAAIALYGSKASNGVILITTKRGKAGRIALNFRHQTDISTRLKGKIKVLSQDEYLELLYETYRNSIPGITDAEIKTDLISKFPYRVVSPGDTSFYPASDWVGEFYNNAAISIANEISVSGGNERSNFYLNLEYTKQDGIVKHTGFDRKSLRFNYENKPFAFLKLGINTGLSYNIQKYRNGGEFQNILAISPLNPARQANGEYIYNYAFGLGSSGFDSLPNPLAANELNSFKNIAYRGLSKMYAELKFLQHFKFTSSVGIDFMLNEINRKVHPLLVIDGTISYGGSVQKQEIRNANIISNNILGYNRVLNSNHTVGVLLGQEAQILTNRYTFIEKTGFWNNPSQDQINSGNISNATGSSGRQTLLSYFGQANYGFKNKYFFSASVRTDGSSRFGENQRFGTYWSTGGGWIVTEEPFMKSSNVWLSYLKLRGSIGAAGNSSAISDRIKYDLLDLVNYFGSTAVLPIRTSQPGNPGIQWENTFIWDAGLELRALKERIAITIDIYNRKTTELIGNILIPATTGFSTLRDNIGDMRNKGVEISLSSTIIHSKDFDWKLSANWSRNQNKLIKSYFPFEVVSGNGLANEVGREYNSFYLPVWAGVDPATGRPLWLDETGKPNEDYEAAKKEFVGKAQPDGFGALMTSFAYKGFELSAMANYQYGFQIYHYGSLLENDGLSPYINQSKAALNRWRQPGDIAANPRRLLYGADASGIADRGTGYSTRYLFDGDFIRLSNIMLAYSLSRNLLNRIHLQGARVFIQGHNLATWTKYKGPDPESTNAYGLGSFMYPPQRTFSIGLNVTL